VPTKRPMFLYSVLACLFAITLVYQIRYIPDLIRRETIHFPFFFVEEGGNTISFSNRETTGLGVHNGDHLLAVNGTPFIGAGQLGKAFRDIQVGIPIVVTIAPKSAPDEQRSISLPVTRAQFHSWDTASDMVVELLLPAVSLVLGFWVAFRRPRDPLAWLLLALMMSFPHILQAFIVQGWPPGWRVAGVLYELILEAAFPIVIFMFGRFFPEPFPPGSR
jgi:hypothetical protein